MTITVGKTGSWRQGIDNLDDSQITVFGTDSLNINCLEQQEAHTITQELSVTTASTANIVITIFVNAVLVITPSFNGILSFPVFVIWNFQFLSKTI